ncbi:MAG: 2-hydroxyacyl-CoA dehydratase [Candidatus Hydrogenedentota bacterium]|nr:MAG: 2-hydroxyacyl-CoA dehydratase [Candidatus Hydrogenedentota bacterium]
MTTEQRNALERIVEAFQMGAMLPEDMDIDSPEMKALIEMMPEGRRNTFLAMARDPDVRKMSNVFNGGLGRYWESVLNAKERGKKVVFVPFNFAPEICFAMDLIPVCVEVLNTMVLTLEEGLEPYLDLAVERGLPDTMCSAQRGIVGLLEAGLLDKPDLLMNGALGGCDPNSKVFEYMGEKFDVPTLYLDLPYYHDERALDYYTKGYKKIVNALEEMTGHTLDPDRLREVVDHTNQATELFMEINELKRNVPNPVPNYYNMQHTGTKLMMAGTPDAVEYYRTALDVCKDRLKKGKHVLPEERVRVFFMYTGYYFDNEIYSWFQEEMGASYVMDVLAAFDFNPYIDTSSMDTMIRGLAEVMLNLPMTRQLKGSWNMPANWLDDVLYYARTYKADCCVFTGHTACKQAWGVYRLVADEVKKQLGIPSLRLEGDGWDARITPMSVIKEQFEEFFATLL